MLRLSPLLAVTALVLQAEGPVPLFNGRDLTGWVHEGPNPSFYVENGELRTRGSAFPPNWLRTEREYENFRLKFEYKLDEWAEAAVILRAPRTSRPQPAAIPIMLAHDFHNQVTTYVTGAIQGARKPLNALPPSHGKWHKAEVQVWQDHIEATIDSVKVQDVGFDTEPALLHRGRGRYIGFPDMGYKYALRNMTIEDLGPDKGWIDLFNGRSIQGWELRGGGKWSVHDGILSGENGHGVLYAPGTFQNFELVMAVRTHQFVNSGVFLRGSSKEGETRGSEIQIYSPVDAVYPTGSVYRLSRSRLSADLEGRWFFLQIELIGARCRVWVDGELSAEYDRVPESLGGPARVGFQIHSDNARVEFRDIRIRVK